MGAVVVTAPERSDQWERRVPPRRHLRLVHPPDAVGIDVGGPVARPRRRPSAATFRRRRVVVLVLVGLGLFTTARAAATLGGPPLATPERPPAATSYAVQPGDSLWTIAEEIAPGTDPRPIVDQLSAERDGRPLLVGERITWGG